MTTLAEFMIIAGADNRPPMTKKYEELSVAEKHQVNCDLKATNIVLQGLPLNVYAIVNHKKVAKEICDRVKLLMKGTKFSLQEKDCLAVPMFTQGDDQIFCLNKAMALLTAVASSRVMLLFLREIVKEDIQGLLDIIIVKDLDAYDSDCDDVSHAKAVLVANLSNYGSDIITEKAQRIKPTLYDGSVISSQHVVIPVIDDEETLILKEVSRSKIVAKQHDPIYKENKVHTTPINYVKLNRMSKDFGKRFVPQQELSAEQAIWLQTSNLKTNQSDISPVKIKAPRELPKRVRNCSGDVRVYGVVWGKR
uniref:Uncharacterized protein n=1 Tax=Tanacetum cinerariifolium TaxID=118510 RepID=A0A6L2MR74_TANCI|nr:hypothetical protein [Tanacetum cinerariifolium]